MIELVTKADLASALETQTLLLTARFGVMLAAAVALLSSRDQAELIAQIPPMQHLTAARE